MVKSMYKRSIRSIALKETISGYVSCFVFHLVEFWITDGRGKGTNPKGEGTNLFFVTMLYDVSKDANKF